MITDNAGDIYLCITKLRIFGVCDKNCEFKLRMMLVDFVRRLSPGLLSPQLGATRRNDFGDHLGGLFGVVLTIR